MSLYQPTEENDIIEHGVNQLARKYAGKFDETEIRPIVKESYESFADAKVRTFVAVFTTRYADDRLRAMAKVRGLITDAPPSVLFVCVHNAGRSQMAAGWVRHLSKGKVEVYSGGSLPGKDLNTAAVAAMQEVGIDIANEFPKPFAVEIVQAADVVITMGCGDTCPIFPGKRYEDWALDDPAGLGVEAVRPIRDEIRRRVESLISDLGVSIR
ncbi:MAG: arsenate reductase ArsC [Ilumatobacteraceae bacterium]|jgi:arsenate reductase|nr:arsenate reductase ArsC [Ilumatobacteraceae bacterium]